MSEATKIPSETYWGVDWASGPDEGIISEWRRNEHGGLEFVRLVVPNRGTDGN